MITQKRVWSFASLFVIALVISLPFYVADVYAVSVSVTKNRGEAGIEGFIDAEGDVWTVEATIGGTDEEVEAENVKMKVGANEAIFNSCSSGGVGGTVAVCEYASLLSDGVNENMYSFNVLFHPAVGGTVSSPSQAIKADGSAPVITFNSIKQEKGTGEIKLDFSVKDKPEGYCAGLEKVEIVDVDGGETVQTVNSFEEEDCEFNFVEDAGGVLEGSLAGEGRKSLKVKAVDRLGHESSKSKSFDADFVAPIIDDEITFVSFGEFIGQHRAETDIKIKVIEGGDRLKARAYSEQAELDGEEVECKLQEGDVWICTWENIGVSSVESVSVRVVAEDEMGNTAEKTLGKSFVVDSSAPEVIFFGTERTFNDESYVKEGTNRIILKVDEQGAGISKEGIKANLKALGGEQFDAPDECEETETTYNCYWDVTKTSFNEGTASIGLSYFKDKVGNEGHKPGIEVQVDTSGPKVEKVEIYGLGETGKRNYFQSNDLLRIEMEVAESSGLFILVNLNDVIMDAETKFEGQREVGEAGWQAFTEEDCEREEGKWICALETEEVKSGPDIVDLQIKVLDTAGNEAAWLKEPKNVKSGSKGDYKLDLLGVTVEEEPDFWEVSSVKPLGGEDDFVDMDITEQISSRMAMKVKLRTDSDAKAVKIDLVGCEPEEGFDYDQREILFDNLMGGTDDAPEPILILEFSPNFNSKEYFEVGETEKVFEKAELEYTCYLSIYSRVGKKALKYAELQEVKVKVPFAFTELGSKDENLEKRIKDAKSGYYESTEWLGTVSKVLEWLSYLANIATTIVTVNQISDIFSESLREGATSVTAGSAGILEGVSQVLRGNCFALQVGQESSWDWVRYIQIPAGILSCQPTSVKEWETIGASWYMWWQRTVLDTYNVATGRGLLGIPAGSLYDNFYVAFLGLCVPGIVYNLKQLREIHCRKIVCLQQEVPQGIATVESCDKLFDLLECEFFAGPFFALIPGISTLSVIGDMLKGIFVSPLGLISLLELGLCAALCFDPTPGTLTLCKVGRFIDKALTLIDSIVGFVKQRPDLTTSPYCDLVKEEREEVEEEEAPVEEAEV